MNIKYFLSLIMLINPLKTQKCNEIKTKDKLDCMKIRLNEKVCCLNRKEDKCEEKETKYSGDYTEEFDCSIPIQSCGPKFGEDAKACSIGNEDVIGGLCCVDYQGSCMSVPYYYKKNNKFQCFEPKIYHPSYGRIILSSISILIVVLKIYYDDKKKKDNVKVD